jgi:hypothetical protein
MFLQNAALVCGEVQRACAAKPRKHLPLRTSPLLRAYLLNAPAPQTLTGPGATGPSRPCSSAAVVFPLLVEKLNFVDDYYP